MKRIGISGSNGKSTTVRWTAAAINSDDTPVACVWSGGDSFHGKAVQVDHTMEGFLRFDRTVEESGAAALVVEITSMALARGFANRWSCDIAVLTNVTHEHHDDHGSEMAYVRAKARLFDAVRPDGLAVFTASDRIAADLVRKARPDIRWCGYRLADRTPFASESFTGRIREMSWDRTCLEIESDTPGSACVTLTVPGPGEHFAENGLAAWIAATSAGIDPEQAATRIGRSSLPSGRFDVVGRSPTVIVDYGHTPDALARTLQACHRLTRGKLILVLGAHGLMDRPKRLAMGAAACVADEIVLSSHNPLHFDPVDIAREVREGMRSESQSHTTIVPDRRRAILDTIAHAHSDDTVLIAGRGDEPIQRVGDLHVPLVDREIALEALRRRE